MEGDQSTIGTRCWICGGGSVRVWMEGSSPETLSPRDFAITDAHYGKTLTIWQCAECGYRFCPGFSRAVSYYEALEDEEYEKTRPQRAMQARVLLETIRALKPSGTLLDVGAGSGILVEEALAMGYGASGIEPSAWLVDRAVERALPVSRGIFPRPDEPSYDVIALIDVVEHVDRPVDLLRDIALHLRAGGVAAVVTPDVRSVAARLAGKKWWHYRIAHLSYFDKRTLAAALKRAGLEPVSWRRPTWYFPLSYLLERVGVYLPFVRPLASLGAAKRIRVPLNLFDSWLVLAKKAA